MSQFREKCVTDGRTGGGKYIRSFRQIWDPKIEQSDWSRAVGNKSGEPEFFQKWGGGGVIATLIFAIV